MKGVIYARFSCDRQHETSIEGQLKVNYDYAKKHNITIVNEYIDRAISGRTDKRPSFNQMIEDAKEGKFDCIIVYKLDRFARDRYLSTIYKHQLKKNKVKLISALENINSDTPESVLLESLLEGLAEFYSLNLSQAVSRGIAVQKSKCKYTGGPVPYGYKIDEDKNYIIDESKVPYVKTIFNMYVKGEKLKNIVKYLNDNNQTTGRGAKFTLQALYPILTNEKYIGIFKYKDEIKEDAVPPILDKQIFIQANEILNKTYKKPIIKNKETYLLSGKLICGKCNEHYISSSGTSGASNKKMYYYYKCKNKCHKPLKKDDIESLVFNSTVDYILKEEILNHVSKKVYDLYEETKNNESLVSAYKKQLSKVNRSINNILKAIEEGVFTNSTKGRLQELEKEKEDIEIEIAKESIKKPIIPIEYIQFYFSNMLTECTDIKKIIELFIHSIIVFDDHIEIIYNCTDTSNSVRGNLNLVKHTLSCTNSNNIITIYNNLTFGLSISLYR